jgi:hypothetical protein
VARLRSFLGSLTLVVLSLALCAALLEAAARVAARRRPAEPGRAISRYHPMLGWDKPPGGAMRITRDEYDVFVAMNSKGLRGPERDYEKRPGTRRVLFLGDSFAEGYYVDEEGSARALLEGSLNGDGGCQRHEVVNGATAAYSTDQESLFFDVEGRKYSPDLVIVFFYYNDLYYNTTGIGTGGKPKPYFDVEGDTLVLRNVPVPKTENTAERGARPWRGSYALRMLGERTVNASPRLHRALARFGLVEPVSTEPFREFWPYGLGHRDEVEDMWRRTAVILKALRSQVEASGARLAVLYVPSRLEVNDEALRLTEERYRIPLSKTRNAIANRLRRTCEILGVPMIDPRPPLRAAETGSAPAYFPGDGHWNAVGNRIVAGELLGFVRQALPCPPEGK